MDHQTRTMNRDEVVTAERRAWAEADRESGRGYFFDGINFWHGRGRGEPQLVPQWLTPRAGWRHREDCRCRECAS
jgi:hypothetical protein